MKTVFDQIRSYFSLDLSIELITALTVRSGSDSPDPTAPDNGFIRITTPSGNTVYIPGSSIKGIFRSHSEGILTAFNKEVCGFTIRKNSDCGAKEEGKRRLDQYSDIAKRYLKSCYACRMYGSTAISSITRFDDFYPYKNEHSDEEKKAKVSEILKYLSVRHGIKIDRKSGSVARGALYDVEVLTGGEFYGSVQLRNPEVWQLGILFKTIDDINDGYQKIGGMKSRGLGRVKIHIDKLKVLSSDKKVVFMKFDNNFKEEKLSFSSIGEPISGIPPYKFELIDNDIDKFKSDVYDYLETMSW